jgi:hypothetical protein
MCAPILVSYSRLGCYFNRRIWSALRISLDCHSIWFYIASLCADSIFPHLVPTCKRLPILNLSFATYTFTRMCTVVLMLICLLVLIWRVSLWSNNCLDIPSENSFFFVSASSFLVSRKPGGCFRHVAQCGDWLIKWEGSHITLPRGWNRKSSKFA